MTVKRRVFNRYLGIGLAVGGSAGYVGGRYLGQTDGMLQEIPVRVALREAAKAAPGIHLIGLSIEGIAQISAAGAEVALLDHLGYQGTERLYTDDFLQALDERIRRDYAQGKVVQLQEYVLSETEKMFIAYALVQRGLNNTAYTPPPLEIRDGIIFEGAKFGPKYTVVGQKFNEQPDGHGGLWVAAENTPPGTVITVNGKKIKTTWKSNTLTGAIYGKRLQALIERPGKHEVALFVPETRIRQFIGELEIRPRPAAAILEDGSESTVFCEIEQWDVSKSKQGEELRVRSSCGPRSSVVYIGEVALTTRVRPSVIAAILDRSTLSVGEHSVRLVDTHSGEAVSLGTFEVE